MAKEGARQTESCKKNGFSASHSFNQSSQVFSSIHTAKMLTSGLTLDSSFSRDGQQLAEAFNGVLETVVEGFIDAFLQSSPINLMMLSERRQASVPPPSPGADAHEITAEFIHFCGGRDSKTHQISKTFSICQQ